MQGAPGDSLASDGLAGPESSPIKSLDPSKPSNYVGWIGPNSYWMIQVLVRLQRLRRAEGGVCQVDPAVRQVCQAVLRCLRLPSICLLSRLRTSLEPVCLPFLAFWTARGDDARRAVSC